MARENFNRYDNDKKRNGQQKQEKKLRSPISKGSMRTRDKRDLKRAIDFYDQGEEEQ